MKSPFRKYYMTFWDMTIYSGIFHCSDISLNHDLVTEKDPITEFDLIATFRKISIEYLKQVRLANRGRLLLWTPGLVPFGTCIHSNVEIVLP